VEGQAKDGEKKKSDSDVVKSERFEEEGIGSFCSAAKKSFICFD